MAKQNDDFDRILQDCLEKIQQGAETLDDVLARHPALADELRPVLEAALWIQSRKTTLEPRPGFVNASRHRLIDQIRQEQSAVPIRQTGSRWAGLKQTFAALFSQKRLALQFLVTLALVLAVIIGSASVARASEYAMPGELLYRVKQTVEKTELAFTPDVAGKAQLYVRNAERRLVEIRTLLIENQPELVSETVALFEENVQDAVRSMILVGERDPERAQELVDNLGASLNGEAESIRLLEASAPQDVQSDLDRLLTIAGGVFDLAEQDLTAAELTATITATATATFTSSPTLTMPAPTNTLAPPSNTPVPRISPEKVATNTPTPAAFVTSTPTSTPGIGSGEKRSTDTPTPTLKSKPTKTPRPAKTKKSLPNPTRRPPKPDK